MSSEDSTGTVGRVSRRRFLATTSATGMTLGLAGCFGGGSSSNEAVTYISNNNSPQFKEMLRGFAEDFEAERDIPVDIEFTEIGGDYGQRVSQLIQAGNPPDIINAEQFRIGAYATQDILRPVGDVIEAVEEAEEAIPEKFGFVYDGEHRLVPAVASLANNWYRTDIYDELGLDAPTTWEAEREAAQAITEADNDLYGLGYTTAATVYGSYHAWNRLWGNDAQVAMRNGDAVEVAIDSGGNRDRVREVLERAQQMVEYSPTATNWDWGEIYESYAGGTTATALYSGGRPKTQSIGQDRPWADATKRVSNPYNTSNRDGHLGNSAATGYALVQGSSNPEGAKEFVQYMVTGERLVEYARALRFHNIPIFESWYEPGSAYREGWDYLNDNFDEETIQSEREALFSDSTAPFTAETEPANPYASPAFTSFQLGQMFYDATEGGMGIDQAIDQTASTLRENTGME
ncbi:ABC transporter substrate-binding protein [Haloplanus halobius]|uniref:ABC transporter substrate-binding protein n=1 Tax=Haloplanus halobius TaxID=2934938 RepID=UPI00200D46D5|nr:extracellular solute-binding protein [Haloplanus sp. XH21]